LFSIFSAFEELADGACTEATLFQDYAPDNAEK
jgi:hypothetical protein